MIRVKLVYGLPEGWGLDLEHPENIILTVNSKPRSKGLDSTANKATVVFGAFNHQILNY